MGRRIQREYSVAHHLLTIIHIRYCGFHPVTGQFFFLLPLKASRHIMHALVFLLSSLVALDLPSPPPGSISSSRSDVDNTRARDVTYITVGHHHCDLDKGVGHGRLILLHGHVESSVIGPV